MSLSSIYPPLHSLRLPRRSNAALAASEIILLPCSAPRLPPPVLLLKRLLPPLKRHSPPMPKLRRVSKETRSDNKGSFASTAEVERGFSHQNIIKYKSRNRLSSIHLDQLLRLRLNSPETHNFPLQQAYQNRVNLKQRRFIVKKHWNFRN